MSAEPRPAARSVVANSVVLVAAQIAIKLLGFGLVVALTRVLGVAEYGRFAFAFAFTALFSPLADLGTDFHVTRQVAREPQRAGAQLGASLSLKLVLFVATLALVLAIAAALGHPPGMLALIGCAAATVGLGTLATSWFAVFRGLQRMDLEAVTSVGLRLVVVLAALAALALGGRALAVAGAQAGATALGIALPLVAAHRHGLRAAFADARARWGGMLRGGFPFAVTAVLVMIYFRIDQVMVFHMKGARSVGLYGAAANLLFAGLILSQALVTAVFPVVARAGSLADERVRAVLRRAFTLSLAASVPFVIGAAALAPRVLELFYGAPYAAAGRALTLLMGTLPVLFATNLFGNCLGALGRQRTVLAVSLVNAVLNVGLNLWLIPRLDYDGAALATLVTECVGLTLFLAILRRDTAGLLPARGIAGLVVSNGVLAALLVLLRRAPLIPVLVVAVLAYLAVVFATGLVRPSDVRALIAVGRTEPRA